MLLPAKQGSSLLQQREFTAKTSVPGSAKRPSSRCCQLLQMSSSAYLKLERHLCLKSGQLAQIAALLRSGHRFRSGRRFHGRHGLSCRRLRQLVLDLLLLQLFQLRF
jgi:hypothetical protein